MSNTVSNPPDFYTLAVGPNGGYVVRGWNDHTVLSVHDKQFQAREEAKRLNLEGHETAPIELPETLIYGAAVRARLDGMSSTDWIRSAVEERIRNEELSDRMFRRQSKGASREDINEILDLMRDLPEPPPPNPEASARLLAILNKVPNNPPDPGDEFEL